MCLCTPEPWLSCVSKEQLLEGGRELLPGFADHQQSDGVGSVVSQARSQQLSLVLPCPRACSLLVWLVVQHS